MQLQDTINESGFVDDSIAAMKGQELRALVWVIRSRVRSTLSRVIIQGEKYPK